MKRLHGWWRLWIVFTALIIGIAVFYAFTLRDYRTDINRTLARAGHTYVSGCVPGTVSLQETDAYERLGTVTDGPWNDYKVPPPPAGAILEKDDPAFQLVASCTSYNGVFKSVAVASLFSAVVLLCALTLKWIAQGFRNRSA